MADIVIQKIVPPSQSPQWRSKGAESNVLTGRGASLIDVNIDFGNGEVKAVIPRVSSVRKQIANVLLTLKGTMDYLPLYGSWLPLRIFEQVNPIKARDIQIDVSDALRNNMQGVIDITGAGVTVSPSDDYNGWIITMEYTIIDINQTDSFSMGVKAL